MVVQVGIDPEEAAVDRLHRGEKVLRERSACDPLCAEGRLASVSLAPHKSMVNQTYPFDSEKCPRRPACLAPTSSNGPRILPMTHDRSACSYGTPAPASLSAGEVCEGKRLTRCRHLCRLSEANPVLPMVLETRSRAHNRTFLRRAELGDAAVLQLRHTASTGVLGCMQSLSQGPRTYEHVELIEKVDRCSVACQSS